MARLSSSVADMKSRYDVVVVGSGYGGAIAACRLAQRGYSVCVLERGREIRPGEYPDTALKAAAEIQVDLPGRHYFSPTALFDFRLNREMNVVVGCGLGGTSLINANVALKPEPWVLEDAAWPVEIQDDARSGALEEYFVRAQRMLNSTDYPPPGFPSLPKQQALERTNAAVGARRPFQRPLINVTFKEGINKFGVHQRACQLCGDCVSGCNYAAKNTVLMNYLPEAKRHGAELFTETSVRFVTREGNEWVVRFDLTGSGRPTFSAASLTVRAGVVVLAAGTLGSTEILLRSREEGRLPLSPCLGRGFTGNGDVFALAYNGTEPIDGVGAGFRRPDLHHQVGPCITGMIDLRSGRREDQIIIEEGSIPGALGSVIPFLLGAASFLWGRPSAAPGNRTVVEQVTRWSRHLAGAYHGAVRRTQTLLAMAHDDSGGRMRLVDDRLRVEWPGLESQPIYGLIDEKLRKVSQSLQATHIGNPFRLVTVHPLGGCCMGQDARSGVVDHECRVFAGEAGAAVHEGLYVCDGSIIPRSLGANPLLTISALAERAAERLIGRENVRLPGPAIAPPGLPTFKPMFYERARPGLEFTEHMTGHFAWVDDARERHPVDGRGPWRRAVRPGAVTHDLTLDLTIVAEDVEALVSQRDHVGRIVGTVLAPELCPTPMRVSEGRFHLFFLEHDHVETRVLRYWMRVETPAEANAPPRTYVIKGDKVARNVRRAKLWPDLSTLYVTVAAEGIGRQGRGIVRLTMGDFLRQLATIRPRHAQGLGERLDVYVRFLGHFLAMLRSLYGRRLARQNISTLDAPVEGRRQPPRCTRTFEIPTSDGTAIHLSRYRGGDRGPVLLSPGFSVRASSFAADTVRQNLVEYLGQRGYDVWLLDYRASSGFSAAGTDFSIDDVAIRDYPAAVNTIRSVTGVDRIQIVAHCVGSMSLLMSLLAGKLRDQVRSIVCSQLGLHPIAPPFSEFKGAVYAASLLRRFRVKRITAQYDPYSLLHRFWDRVLALYPVAERCNNPTCRRILLLFGESFRHSQLNTATHDAMHEWFGTTSVPGLAHLALMLRMGHVVDRDGVNTYMPHLERLRLPISFIHGTKNREFLPKATKKTYRLLCRKNGSKWYVWREIKNYGHMDCFIGKNAAADVFPVILRELEKWPRPG
jgi:cholesterol oxidase